MKKIEFILISLSGCMAAWFGFQAIAGLWHYYDLDLPVQAEARSWEVRQLGNAKFAIATSYVYAVDSRPYENEALSKEPYFYNRPAAEAEIKKLSQQPLEVWVSTQRPERSDVNRIFPLKKILYAAITIGVTLYFALLNKLHFAG